MDSQNIVPTEAVETMPTAAEIPVSVIPSEGYMQQSWFEMIQNFFVGYPMWAVELGVFGVGGLLVGFLFKGIGRFLVLLAILGISIAVILHYTQVVVLPVAKIKTLLGLRDVFSIQEGFQVFAAWSREHLIALLSLIVGLLLGWKLG